MAESDNNKVCPQYESLPVRRKRVLRNCAICHKAMILRPSNKALTCSRDCGWKLAGETASAKHSQLRPLRLCWGCKSEFKRVLSSGHDIAKYCSKSCEITHRKHVALEVQAIYRIALRRKNLERSISRCKKAASIATLKQARMVRSCLDCGAQFTQRTNWGCPEKRCLSCIAELMKKNKRIAKGIRRARIRGAVYESIDPIKVFDRDGWRCHICKKLTDKSKRGTYDDRAPELDHVISLAQGGSHTWGNVACSCRACNSMKGAKSLGQLSMAIAC